MAIPKPILNATIRQQALDLIRQSPDGINTFRLTLAQRRHLRALEQAGLIEFRDNKWYPKPEEEKK